MYLAGKVVHRLDGHDNVHIAVCELIENLPQCVAGAQVGDEIVLSIYVWPRDFDNDSGFVLDVPETSRLAELGCAFNVVFMADNAGPLR